MTIPKETEIKLELPRSAVGRLEKIALLRDLKEPKHRETYVSVYFDTNKLHLKKHGFTFRVRRVGDRYVQTIKAERPGLDRDEWETDIPDNKPDLAAARNTGLALVLSKKVERRLRPIFETRVRRTIYPLGDEATGLTLDVGKIDTGEASSPLCEVEVETKHGDKTKLFKIANKIARATPAQLALKSKAQRGYELVANDRDATAKADPIALPPGLTTREAFRAIGYSCLKQVIDNKPALFNGDPEGVHQMRVGLRRLRSAISLFADIVDGPQTDTIKQDLKWLTDELGPARELEVFIAKVITPAQQHPKRWRGLSRISHDFVHRRAAAVEQAQEVVRSERFRCLMLDVASWLEIGEWTAPDDDLVRERGDMPIETSAPAQLTLRWKKIRKKGRNLAKLDPRSRHKLRIQAKKMRYALDFYASIFEGSTRRRETFRSALKDMQDCLGELNDITVHRDLAAGVVGRSVRRRRNAGDPTRTFAVGLLTGQEYGRLDTVLAAAEEAYAELADCKPFWK
jgi:inorganic triphosphatase YgiF